MDGKAVTGKLKRAGEGWAATLSDGTPVRLAPGEGDDLRVTVAAESCVAQRLVLTAEVRVRRANE